ncbi:DUF1611 domain-containing protein [Flavihumibacter sp. ZG627]|uniref:DUF1611 domain-containing protein n=1 Tax=Flavihumibacter sp. ZG627 TaxID=1463156 RepID=UPI00057FD517|nr:DUF1611 domain-containing protein [Flavihumibacter sp. ZG627]KIC92227.1 protein often near L-alanine-DL-glutamate epimerase (cell wall recycling) [Flavihumibacter sp. ZG627]
MEKPGAIILTNGILLHSDAKTAHGLIRGTERFCIVGVIDDVYAGNDAGELLDGRHRNIPVYGTIEEAVNSVADIRYCIIGIATIGGILPESFIPLIETAIRRGMHIVNGLHDFLGDRHRLVSLAADNWVDLIDIRRPKLRADLHFWTGKIFDVKAKIVAVLGMDCAMGKRTTCRMIREACTARGIHAEMIYTGQTGWLQGGRFGFIFDSTLNDFISGEVEYSIVSCSEQTGAEIILLEGQSALRNPSGPAGSEFLVSGNARYTVLVYAPKRKHYEHLPEWGEIPSLESEIELIGLYGSKVIAVALNTEDCSDEEAYYYQQEFSSRLDLPVLLPLQQGVDEIIDVFRSILQSS